MVFKDAALKPKPGPPLDAAHEASAEVRREAEAEAEAGLATKPRRAVFNRQIFAFEGERYAFNLYVPAAPDASAAMPLVVMLHGCQQDAPDFARGTGMNECAGRVPCVVLYPEQLASLNPMRCWNWFDLAHQGRHAGEPAMLAALTRQVAVRYPVDPRRIYIAGLSAGGAMAAIVAAHNPDLFAAVGVHSGLPPGAAHDVMSAFSAMRHGKRRDGDNGRQDGGTDSGHGSESTEDAGEGEGEGLMPTIVFHGSADRTVHPDNGDQIVQAAIAAVDAASLTLERLEIPQALPAATGELRNTLRTVYRAPSGRSYVEYWSVEAGPHAWSGGSEAGSFTDPHGPPASQAMLDFFLQHRRGGRTAQPAQQPPTERQPSPAPQTSKNKSIKPSHDLPHDRDESANASADQPDGRPSPEISQAAHDLAGGLEDTSRAPEMDQSYKKLTGKPDE